MKRIENFLYNDIVLYSKGWFSSKEDIVWKDLAYFFSKIYAFPPKNESEVALLMLMVLGKTIYINIKWLNFELTIKHISLDYKSPRINFYSPSITINQYNNSGYQFTFEIFIFGYTYRKGLFRLKDREVMPTDNTYGFVDESWFEQFRRNDAENLRNAIY